MKYGDKFGWVVRPLPKYLEQIQILRGTKSKSQRIHNYHRLPKDQLKFHFIDNLIIEKQSMFQLAQKH